MLLAPVPAPFREVLSPVGTKSLWDSSCVPQEGAVPVEGLELGRKERSGEEDGVGRKENLGEIRVEEMIFEWVKDPVC